MRTFIHKFICVQLYIFCMGSIAFSQQMSEIGLHTSTNKVPEFKMVRRPAAENIIAALRITLVRLEDESRLHNSKFLSLFAINQFIKENPDFKPNNIELISENIDNYIQKILIIGVENQINKENDLRKIDELKNKLKQLTRVLKSPVELANDRERFTVMVLHGQIKKELNKVISNIIQTWSIFQTEGVVKVGYKLKTGFIITEDYRSSFFETQAKFKKHNVALKQQLNDLYEGFIRYSIADEVQKIEKILNVEIINFNQLEIQENIKITRNQYKQKVLLDRFLELGLFKKAKIELKYLGIDHSTAQEQ